MKNQRVYIGFMLFASLLAACADPIASTTTRTPVNVEHYEHGRHIIAEKPDGIEYLANEVVVRRRTDARGKTLEDSVREIGGAIVGEGTLLAQELGIVRVVLPEDITVDEALLRFTADGTTEFTEPNIVFHPSSTPDDPSYNNLWGMPQIGAPVAWERTTGSRDIIVAVLDTGIDLDHPDLLPNLWVNPGEIPNNGKDDDENGYIDDVHGWDPTHQDAIPDDDQSHGTHVAGTVGAVGNNGTGVVGVNWNVQLMAIKVCAARSCSSTAIAEGILYAARNGAQIANASLGGPGTSTAIYAALNAYRDAGGLFVAAAGNDGSNNDLRPTYPASYPLDNIIAVAASTQNNDLAYFSNYGASEVDLAAPGFSILSSVPGGGYGYKSGTSMATPMVAGASALYLAAAPGSSAQQVKAALLENCQTYPTLAGKVGCGGVLDLAPLFREPNPCELGTDDCADDAACVALVGTDYQCTCNPGFDGDGRTCVDVDECALGTDTCSENARCNNTPGSYVCDCGEGYSGNGIYCRDVDECATGADDCAANAACENTPGGFTCTCDPGYIGNGQRCDDVDECAAGTDDCHANALCTNTPGDYTCTCEAGYVGDGRICKDRDECATGTDNCDGNAVCYNTPGSYDCECGPGFSGDGRSCVDTDECSEGTAQCSPYAICTNTYGSYDCACADGFEGDGFNCGDLDECALGLDFCDPNATCRNEDGGYDCICQPGYSGDGLFCSDVDECELGLAGCAENATCTNTPGSYECECPEGFEGDGERCDDVDECATGRDLCAAQATCTNTPGSYLCDCLPGFLGDGRSCEDEDECALGKFECPANRVCQNDEGSYSCVCREGFELANGTCIDIDECATQTDGCAPNAVCINTVGNHRCECEEGYEGPGTSCVDVDECALFVDACEPNSVCINAPGGFSCPCAPGFVRVGESCVDVDECALDLDDCALNADCINTDGGYECACRTGFLGDGYTCDRPNECTLGTALCDVNATCIDTDVSYSCVCNPGYVGNGFFCSDEDECDADPAPCTADARCENEPGTYRCVCPEGYVGDGETDGIGCTDEDECTTGSNNCAPEAECINEEGGFRCECPEQYAGPGTECWDENECALGSHDCAANARCVNDEGGFRCECEPGFVGDGRASGSGCADEDECSTGSHACNPNADCTDLEGGYACTCQPGYIGDGFTCVPQGDLDECALGLDDCADNAICTNTEGGWRCSCPAGLVGDGRADGVGCADADECATDQDNCDDNATCTDTPGGFQCSCLPGFVGDGVNCADVDECALGTDDCSPDAVCTNTQGSFRCECSEGFIGDGRVCSPNECALGTHRCDDNAICDDEVDGYRCTCLPGYRGDGFSCADIDECTEGTAACSPFARCDNTPGAYDCTCNPGYIGDGRTCAPENECALGTARCDLRATCTDTPDGYTCTCMPGYVGDGFACEDDNECEEPMVCDPSATCENQDGSYTCQCPPNYVGDGTSCDPNECALGIDTCDENADCEDRVPGYQCTCRPGYVGDGESCVDVDECVDGVDDCDPNASCQNTLGGYRCECNDGYYGDGRNCFTAPTQIIGVTAGGDHTCVLHDNGGVRCFGRNTYGQLGYGHHRDLGDDESIGAEDWVAVGEAVVMMDAGVAHTCVLTAVGEVRCFGRNTFGQLGLGHTEDIGDDEEPYLAQAVPLSGTVTKIAAGGEHTCALLDNGRVRCWGLNVYGQLGHGHVSPLGDDESVAGIPDVPLVGRAVDIAAGRDHTCAVMQDSSVFCWGRGTWGALGFGNTADVGDDESLAGAGPVPLGASVAQIRTGWFHTCAILQDGNARCFGYGATGQLGYADIRSIGDDEPASVAGNIFLGGPVVDVALGAFHTCALLGSGDVTCFGWGDSGRLGYGDVEDVGDNEPPVLRGPVPLGGDAVAIAAGTHHTCALLDTGELRCWGDGEYGQLGSGNRQDIGDDEVLVDVTPALSAGFDECALGVADCPAEATCVDLLDGWVCDCPGGFTLRDGSCEDLDECALGTDACHLYATCTNIDGSYGCACDTGYVGDGTNCEADGSVIEQVVTGKRHTCGRMNDGTVRCWGGNGYGQLGYGTVSAVTDAPFLLGDVALGEKVVQLAAGDVHTCALLESGAVRCFGLGLNGRLGLGDTENIGDDETPLSVAAIALDEPAIHVSAGGAHTCAVLASGSVRCWGKGADGQLGYGGSVDIGDDEAPTDIAALWFGEPVLQVSAGEAHTCALLESGAVRCWGLNDLGQLGYGHTSSLGLQETAISLNDVQLGGVALTVSAGEKHSCALLANGQARCWGSNFFGQLGLGHEVLVGDNELPSSQPAIALGQAATQIEAGELHTCARLADGTARCWGYGGSGRLGYGHVQDVGDDELISSIAAIDLGGPVLDLAAGGFHTCARVQADPVELRCFGSNSYGQLGTGDLMNVGDDETPSAVPPVQLR